MRAIESVAIPASGWPQRGHEPQAFHQALRVRETSDKGRGVFVTDRLVEGTVVVVGTPVSLLSERTWQSVQTDIGRHVRIDEPFELVNHSCDPTCAVRFNRRGGYDLVARRSIVGGEEITFDYCTTEWEIVGFERCTCGSEQCRQILRGAKYLSAEELDRYGDLVAPYLRSPY